MRIQTDQQTHLVPLRYGATRPRARLAVHAPTRVVLVENNRLVRDGLSQLLSVFPDIHLVASAISGDLSEICSSDPQVVLLDVGVANGDGLRLTSEIRTRLPLARLIVMDLLPGQAEVVQLVNAGVAGFLMRDASLDELVTTIRSVAEGNNVLPSTMTNTLFLHVVRDAGARRGAPISPAAQMTPREGEVIALIAEGMSNKEIACRLHIATHTVKSHVGNVMGKLSLHSRLQIASYVHSRSRE